MKKKTLSLKPVLNPSKLAKLLSKTAGVGILLSFLLGYHPTLDLPPITRSITYAEAEQTQKIDKASLPIGFQLPHPGYLSTSYSSYHPGVDIASGLGMPIKPIAAGKVTVAGFNFWGLGLMVEIDHGHGYKSTYGHMGKLYVKKDQEIKPDTLIGEVGLTGHTTGPHTHLEVTKENEKIDPLSILPPIRKQPTNEDFLTYKNGKAVSKTP